MTKNSPNKPVATVRDGAMKIAIFKNEPKQEGDRERYSGKLTRSYRDANGEWRDTEYLSGPEYLRGAQLMLRAYEAERQQRAAEKTEEQPAEEGDGPEPSF